MQEKIADSVVTDREHCYGREATHLEMQFAARMFRVTLQSTAKVGLRLVHIALGSRRTRQSACSEKKEMEASQCKRANKMNKRKKTRRVSPRY